MPITFYGYGRDDDDEQVTPIELQAAITRQEFHRQKATGILPANTMWGGFFADTEQSLAVKFAHRPAGLHLVMNSQAGDRICVASYDRLVGSPVDASETIDWAILKDVGLVFVDMELDSSTPEGKRILEALVLIKRHDRREFKRRKSKNVTERRAKGMVLGNAPLGYQTKTIIPAFGRRLKWYFPWPAERNYGQRIVMMHDEMGMSFYQIAIALWKNRVVKPRSGFVTCDNRDACDYYHRCKDGWPLPGGIQWKPPEFKYLCAGRDDEVDVLVDFA